MAAQTIRVLVVDDHPVFAEALAQYLGSQPDFEAVGTAASAEQAMRILREKRVDVVTLDLDLAGEDGLQLGRDIAAQWPDVALVVVTGARDTSRMLEAVQVGARGWVTKDGEIEGLVSALRGAARGETHVPAAMLQRMLNGLAGGGRELSAEGEAVERLTPREREVLRCLMQGMARKQIGELLQVSPNTVRTHVQSILHKLEVHSALTAVALARRGGLDEELGPPGPPGSSGPPGGPGGSRSAHMARRTG